MMISAMRTGVSSVCASVGVLLVVVAGVVREGQLAAFSLMAGLGLLVVSHWLTPCLDRIAVWKKQLLK
jgi:hypothetical protein